MSLKSQVEQLARSAHAAAGGPPKEIRVSKDGVNVRVGVQDAGPIGVSVSEIAVDAERMDGPRAADACRKAAQRTTYLSEPLRVVETDADSGQCQARSDPPRQDDAGRHYFELQGQPRKLRLQRYVKPSTEPRQSEPFDVTHETLGRLVDDLHNAASS